MGVTMIDASAEEAIPMQRFMQDLVRDTSLKTDNLRLVNDNSAKSVLDFDRSSSNRGSRSSTNSSPRLRKKGNLKSSLKKSPKKASNNDLKKKTSHSTLSNMSSTHSAEANDTFDIHSLVLVSDNARVFAKARPKQSRDMLGSASWHSSSEMRKLHTASARWGSNNSNDSSFSHSSMSPPLSARQNKTFSVNRPSVRGGRKHPPMGMMKRQESDSCLVLPKRSSEGPPSMPRRNPPLQNSPPLKFQTPKSEKRRYIGSSRGSPPPPTTTSEEDNDHDDSSSCSSSTSNSCASFSSVSSVEDDLPARMPAAAPTTTRKANAWAALLGSKTKVRSKASTSASAAAYHQPSKPASAPNIFQTAGRRRRTSIVKGPDTAASIFAKNLDSYGPAGLRTDNGVRYSSLPMNLKPTSKSSSFSKKSSSSNNNNNNNTRKPMRHSWNSSRDAIHVPDMLKLPYYDRFVAATSLDSNSSHNSSNSEGKDKPMTKPLSSSSLMSLPTMPSSSASPRNNNTGLPAKPVSSSSLMMMNKHAASNLPYYDRFRATTSLDGPRLPSRASSDSRSPYSGNGHRRAPPSRSHSASAAVRRSASGGGLARRHNNSMALLSPCPEEQIPSGSGRSLRSIQRQRSGGRSTSTGSRLSTRSKSSSSNSSRHSSTDGLLGDDGSSNHSRSTNYSVNSRHSSRGSGVGIGRTYSGRSSKSNSSSRSSYSHSSNDSSVMSALELALGDMAPKRRNRKKPVGMIATTKSSRHNKN